MMKLPIILSCTIILIGCSNHEEQPAQPRASIQGDVQGEFRSKQYHISDTEHVVIFDIPDRDIQNRCWVYINDSTRTSNMRCDDNGDAQLPAQGQELDR